MRKHSRRCIVLAAVAPLVAVMSTQAATISVLPTQWNTIANVSGAFTANSDGAGYHSFAGQGRETLLQFSLSGIPTGATITSVSLAMDMDRDNSTTVQPLFVYRLTNTWGMGNSGSGQTDVGVNGGGGSVYAPTNNDATWNYRFYNARSPASSITWNTVGGDFASNISAYSLIGGGISTNTSTGATGGPLVSTWNGSGMVADVQSWLNGSNPNDGWLLTDFASPGDYPPGGNAFGSDQSRRFIMASNDLDGTAGNPDDRPYLTITYSSVPEPVSLMGVAGIGLLMRRRSRVAATPASLLGRTERRRRRRYSRGAPRNEPCSHEGELQ